MEIVKSKIVGDITEFILVEKKIDRGIEGIVCTGKYKGVHIFVLKESIIEEKINYKITI